MPDQIHVDCLSIMTYIGVSDEERSQAQRVEISVTFPVHNVTAAAKADDLSQTVNYFQVCQTLQQVATQRPRKLIETLAEDLCTALFAAFPIQSIKLEVRKFIIPEAKFICLAIERNSQPAI